MAGTPLEQAPPYLSGKQKSTTTVGNLKIFRQHEQTGKRVFSWDIGDIGDMVVWQGFQRPLYMCVIGDNRGQCASLGVSAFHSFAVDWLYFKINPFYYTPSIRIQSNTNEKIILHALETPSRLQSFVRPTPAGL
jgi:hypothetical protein